MYSTWILDFITSAGKTEVQKQHPAIPPEKATCNGPENI